MRDRQREGSDYTIRVSEIAEYSYCSRAWWYKHVLKLPTPGNADYGRLAAGTKAHRRHGRRVASSVRLRVIGVTLAVFGILALVLALLLR